MDYFAELIGQKQAVDLLTGAIAQNKIAPGYLFVGPAGVGKSIAARCFVEQLFCAQIPASNSHNSSELTNNKNLTSVKNSIRQGNHPDLLWVEPTYLHNGNRLSAAEAAAAGIKRKAPPQIRLEQIREIAQFLGRPPLKAPRSVVVIDQAETMAEAAANGLLKTLEEPGQATLILMAPATESLLPTLVSRCQRIPFYGLAKEQIAQVLKQTGNEEILANQTVLAIAQGSPGQAIACWQQITNIPEDILQKFKQLPKTSRQALELAKQIDKTLDTEAQLWLIDYLQHCYWQQQLQPLLLQKLEQARQYLLTYAQPRLVWEVTLLAITNY